MKKVLIYIMIVFVLVGCVGASPEYPDGAYGEDCDLIFSGVCRIVDKDAGVVCYNATYGISCLPLSQTNLSK